MGRTRARAREQHNGSAMRTPLTYLRVPVIYGRSDVYVYGLWPICVSARAGTILTTPSSGG